MSRPSNFSPTEHLQDVILKTVNREVQDWFRDVANVEDLASARAALRYACLHQELDAIAVTTSRLVLFYLVCSSVNRDHAVAAMPEWWAVRVGADRPQLAILFAEVFPTGKLGKSRWTMHIPHYNRPKGAKPSIPTYTKGHWRGVLTLTDNSKIVVNANSKTECHRVINKLKILTPFELRRDRHGKAIKPQITEDSDSKLKEVRVTPVRADYYRQGRLNETPDWSISLRKK